MEASGLSGIETDGQYESIPCTDDGTNHSDHHHNGIAGAWSYSTDATLDFNMKLKQLGAYQTGADAYCFSGANKWNHADTDAFGGLPLWENQMTGSQSAPHTVPSTVPRTVPRAVPRTAPRTTPHIARVCRAAHCAGPHGTAAAPPQLPCRARAACPARPERRRAESRARHFTTPALPPTPLRPRACPCSPAPPQAACTSTTPP